MKKASKKPGKKEIRRVERAVMEVYQKENPSIHYLDRGPEDLAIEEKKRERLFRDYLKFPPRMFQGARYLDFGCGTGERAIFYSRWGAHCTLVEMNTSALERARKIFSLHAPKGKNTIFLEGSLFEVEPEGPFDIVGSEGVLHHTAAKKMGFAKLVSHLAPGGFVFLGLGNRAGFFQRNLQRLLLYRYAGTEAEIEKLANRFFTENLDRAERFGRRSRRAIIFDTYVNPKIDTTSVSEILDWFRGNRIRFYSSWPPMIPLQFVDVPGKGVLEDLMMAEGVGGIPETLWLSHQYDDAETIGDYIGQSRVLQEQQALMLEQVGNITPEEEVDLNILQEQVRLLRRNVADVNPLRERFQEFQALLGEILEMLEIARSNGPDVMESFLKSTKHLFRGANGVGMFYLIGYKEDDSRA